MENLDIYYSIYEYLTNEFGKRYSQDNLKLMKRFYVVYSKDLIGETLFPQFNNLPQVSSGRRFYLSWSHYLKLMRVDNINERYFYEFVSISYLVFLRSIKVRMYHVDLTITYKTYLVDFAITYESRKPHKYWVFGTQ